MFHLGVSINGGTRKWMVYKGKNPMKMDLGVPSLMETPKCIQVCPLQSLRRSSDHPHPAPSVARPWQSSFDLVHLFYLTTLDNDGTSHEPPALMKPQSSLTQSSLTGVSKESQIGKSTNSTKKQDRDWFSHDFPMDVFPMDFPMGKHR